MSKPKNYIEINSTYRNRTLWPIPSDFDVLTYTTSEFYLDPVCNTVPILDWQNSFTIGSYTNFIDGLNMYLDSNNSYGLSDNLTVLLSKTVDKTNVIGLPRQETNFYTGAVIEFDNGNRRRLTYYEYIGRKEDTLTITDVILIKVDVSFSNNILQNGIIGDPSVITIGTGFPNLFIPTGSTINNFYINKKIQNLITSEYRTIIDYDGITKLATLDSQTSTNWIGGTDYLEFSIRNEIPSYTGDIIASGFKHLTPPLENNYVQLQQSTPNENGIFNDMFLYVYTIDTDIEIGYNSMNEYQQIQTYKSFDGNITILSNSTFNLNTTNNVDYVFTYISIIYNNTILTYQIIEYDITTHIGKIYDIFNVSLIGTLSCFIRTVKTYKPFNNNNIFNDKKYEILPISYDNWKPLSMPVSTNALQQESCYEVELMNLVVPNIILNIGRGGRAVFYPYLYVELSLIDNKSNNLIYSNNPNATKMTFRVIVSDTNGSLITPFIRLRSDGLVQTMKFKPNTNFHFSVRLPNGELISTIQNEFFSPKFPNPNIQISAIFSIRKIS